MAPSRKRTQSTPKMEVKKKTVTIDGEEVTASENWFKKFEENVGEEVKMELAQNMSENVLLIA